MIEPALWAIEPVEQAAGPGRSKPLATAVKRRLERGGLMDPFTGATRTARQRRCQSCRGPVWRGLDARWCARDVDADPWPLTAFGEAMALFCHWRTVSLVHRGGVYEIDLRDRWIIGGEPAGSKLNTDVLTVHICGRSIEELPHGPSRIHLATSESNLPIECPF